MKAILAEHVDESSAILLAGGMRGSRADRGRVVADVVIARQVAAVHRQGSVQFLPIFKIAAAGRTIPRHIAAIDDEVGPGGGDVLTDALEIVGQTGKAG